MPQRDVEVREHYRILAKDYEKRANQTCEAAYAQIAKEFLSHGKRILEIGSGCSGLLQHLPAPSAVASDLSWHMLAERPPEARGLRVSASGAMLPFESDVFDAVFSVNVVEHVPAFKELLAEKARVLACGGLLLVITPNGDWERWLDLAERLHMKIPEGPHRFLRHSELLAAVGEVVDVVQATTMLVLPAGPAGLARAIDRVSRAGRRNWGFFQYIVGRKPAQGARRK